MRVELKRLLQLKATFEDYLFVKKLSGTGWDDEEKHATGTTDYIDGFAAVRRPSLFFALLNVQL
jgi:hypothetical protein